MELNRTEVLTFVRKHLKNLFRLDGEYYTEHVISRAKRAEHFATLHWDYVDEVSLSRVDWLSESWVYGMLFDIFTVSSVKLEDVIAITSVELADVITRLSVDNKLPFVKREKKVLGELYDVRETVYYAIIADIECSLKNYERNHLLEANTSNTNIRQEFQSFKLRVNYIKKKLTHILCLYDLFYVMECKINYVLKP